MLEWLNTVLSEICAEALSTFAPVDLRRLLQKGANFGGAVNFFPDFYSTLLISNANIGNRSLGIIYDFLQYIGTYTALDGNSRL